jgi:hypothetical protein
VSTSPAVAPVVETVSRRRVVPATEIAREQSAQKPTEFWELLESMTDEMWAGDYMLYILREDPKPSNYGGTNTVDKCPGYMTMPSGARLRLDSREDVELGIKEKFGGKAFRLILKKGRERITEGKCMNEAPPKYPDTQPTASYAGSAAHAGSNDPNAGVASLAINAMANQQPDAVRLAMEVLRSASDIVMRQAQPPTNPTEPRRLVDDQIVAALIQKALNPPAPPDPLETFMKMKDLFQPPATNSVQQTLELISSLKNSGLVGASGRAAGGWDLIAQAVPSVVQGVTQSMHEWRLGMEAQERGVTIATGLNARPGVPVAVPVTPQSLPEPAAPAAAAGGAAGSADSSRENPGGQPGGQSVSSDPPFQWIEQKIVEILKQNRTVDETVDEVLAFLYVASPGAVALLLDPPKMHPMLKPGEEGILQLFQHEPILQQIPVGPRLTEFIRKFVAAAKDEEGNRAMSSNAAIPPAPPSA